MNPYKDISTTSNKTVRVFTQDVDSHELVWHRDREDRIVRVLEGSGWKFQLDNNLPIQLNEGDVIHIPKYEYHRIIKGDTDLKVELYKIVDNLLEESSNRKESVVKEMAKSDVQKVDQFADKILNPVDVDLTSKHFFDRLNDPRNEKDINQAELIGFFKRLSRSKKKFIEFLDTYKQVVATDDRTNINIPFMKRANRAIAKTIMRKKNFATPNKRISI